MHGGLGGETGGTGGSGGSAGSSGVGGTSGRDGGSGTGGMSGTSGTGGRSGTSGGTSGTNGLDAGPNDGGAPEAGPPEGDCDDDAKNGTETDTDCGGSECDPCGEGDTCLSSNDCAEGFCNDSFTCQSPSCDDGDKNGSETDEDCGGDCDDPCANGKGCEEDDDCTSGSCGSGSPKTCECAAQAPADVCGATECGMKSDGCIGMVTCPYTCPADMTCSGGSCVSMTVCDPDDCTNSCTFFIQTRCCKGDGTCGCRSIVGSSCG